MTAQEIIAWATKKYDKLLSRNQYYYNDNKKYLNFTADGKGKSSNPRSDHLKAIEEWRKHKIPGKEVIEKDGRTYYFCPHHKNGEFGYPEGLYVCSHHPDQHEEYMAYRKMNKPFHINKSSDKPKENTPPSKQLAMTEAFKKVLTTTQPHLDQAQVDSFMQKVENELKE